MKVIKLYTAAAAAAVMTDHHRETTPTARTSESREDK